MKLVNSIINVPISITEERWLHIIENHDEMIGQFDAIIETIASPDIIKG